MLKDKSEEEIKLMSIVKVRRAYIRLQHSIAADEQIARELPRFERYVMQQLNESSPVDVEINMNDVVERIEIESSE